jgi:hypothetical protein
MLLTLLMMAGCGPEIRAEADPDSGTLARTRIEDIDFEDYPLGPLGDPWTVSPDPSAGGSTIDVVETGGAHGQVAEMNGDPSGSYLFATLPINSWSPYLEVRVRARPVGGASFIFILNGAGSSIGARRIRLQHPPGTTRLEAQTVPSGTTYCGELLPNEWSRVSLRAHTRLRTFDVLIDGEPTACNDIAAGISTPFTSVQVMDAGNDGWGGVVDFDDLVIVEHP